LTSISCSGFVIKYIDIKHLSSENIRKKEFLKMALCPILKKECIKERCEWWHKWENPMCVIKLIPIRVAEAQNEIRDVYNAIVDR